MQPYERRREPRRRSFLGAELHAGSGGSATDCLVRDIGEGGARLALSATIPLPDSFDIAIAHRPDIRRAYLVWRRDDAAGVALAGLPTPAGLDPAALVRDLRACRVENALLRARLAALGATA